MNKFNRDLLVLFKEESNQQAIKKEVDQLHELLFHVETIANLAVAHEVIFTNKRKITSDFRTFKAIFKQIELKPFVFLNNKN